MASQGQDEITATLPSQRPGAFPESVRMQPGELQGARFTNESDENFPETWTEKSNKFMNILQMAAANPDFADRIDAPDNLYLMKLRRAVFRCAISPAPSGLVRSSATSP